MVNENMALDDFKDRFLGAILSSHPEHCVELMRDDMQDELRHQFQELEKTIRGENKNVTSLICFGFIIGHNWVKKNGSLW